MSSPVRRLKLTTELLPKTPVDTGWKNLKINSSQFDIINWFRLRSAEPLFRGGENSQE